MKKIRIVQIIGILLFFIYVALFIIDLIWGFLHNFDILVFSGLLAIISMTLIAKGVLLKSSSTLWFSINLISIAIILIVFNIAKLDIENNYYILAFIPILASIINLVIFRYIIYFKLIIINISIIIPILILQFLYYSWWINIIFATISIALGIIICRSINLGKEKV